MNFKVTEKVKWEDNVWENLFQLIQAFKTKFDLKIKSMGKDSEIKDKYYFDLDEYMISFEVKGSGFYIIFETDTTKDDFNEKLNFIIKEIQ